MGSMTKRIARNKARNLFLTEKNGSGTFKTEDGRTIPRFMGSAVWFTPAMDSPRNNPIEYKRMAENKKAARILENIAEYKARQRRRKNGKKD